MGLGLAWFALWFGEALGLGHMVEDNGRKGWRRNGFYYGLSPVVCMYIILDLRVGIGIPKKKTWFVRHEVERIQS